MILAGLGWGRLPLWQAERDLAEGRLLRLPTSSLGRGSRSPSRPIWRIASTSRWDRRHGRSGKRCRRWPEPCCLEERRHARFIRYFGDSSYPWR